MDSISQKSIVPKILAKLPARDVARCRCVSWLWRRIVADPSFRALHGANASGGDVKSHNLFVYEIRWRASVDMVVHSSPSSASPMCHITDLSVVAEYSPANACNGFLLLAPRNQDDGCDLCVCNPVTGETLHLSPTPMVQHVSSCTYALGFSPSTLQYKLFCLSFQPNVDCYMDVCTLGGGGGEQWRRHPGRLPYRAVSTPLALVDGKLYFPCGEGSDRILVIDVASEVHRTYHLPKYEGDKVAALAFELRGRLCVAMHVLGQQKLYFWVMPLLQSQDKNHDANLLGWELRYSFHMNDDDDDNNSGADNEQRGAWLNDGDGMLCYRVNDRLYKYNTTKDDLHCQVASLLEWDYQTHLPSPPPSKPQWNVYGGYRPSLVSPQLALAPLHNRKKEFDDSLLRALRCQKCSKKPRF